MSNDDGNSGGLTARTVERVHLSLQESLSEFRLARDNPGSQAAPDYPGVELQESILRFWELLRPHVRNHGPLEEYWEGAVATYPTKRLHTVAELKAYYFDKSVGVWQIQVHTDQITPQPLKQQANGSQPAIADGGELTAAEWGEALNLNKNERVLAADTLDGVHWVKTARMAVLGLRELDHWQIKRREVREDSSGGFMSGSVKGAGFQGENTGSIKTEPVSEPPQKLLTAARMLVEVAEELGAISTYSIADDREAEIKYEGLI